MNSGRLSAASKKSKECGKIGYGDTWTWVAIDADSKLAISYLVSDRGMAVAREFIGDVGKRLAGRVQMTTDAHGPYLGAIEGVFGLDIDYAQLQKFSVPMERAAKRRPSGDTARASAPGRRRRLYSECPTLRTSARPTFRGRI